MLNICYTIYLLYVSFFLPETCKSCKKCIVSYESHNFNISYFIFHISFCPAVGKMKYVMGCPGSTLVVFKVFLTIP